MSSLIIGYNLLICALNKSLFCENTFFFCLFFFFVLIADIFLSSYSTKHQLQTNKIWKESYFESREHTKETKITNLILLIIFVSSTVICNSVYAR